MIDYKEDDFKIEELGNFYSKDKTVFRVFAPEHDTLFLLINDTSYEMVKNHYTFEAEVQGDMEGKKYHFLSNRGIRFNDPFSYTLFEDESIVLDKDKFIKDIIKPKKYDDVFIYEASVRDFSSSDSYIGDYKRKFLALAQDNLKLDNYYMIGLDYLKNLGITHLQLLPVFVFFYDHSDYNWGYNPVAFNNLKKDYIHDTGNPYAYINELRYVVNKLHENNIRVVLDVVYNHVYNDKTFDLEKILPGHFLRRKHDGTLANGTYCGSEIKSEDPFVRAYLLEMSKRYVELFDIDGLRMDLMGILDYHTVRLINEQLKKIKEDFIVYGEGWDMGDVLPQSERASFRNVSKMDDVSMFNDYYRDTIINYILGNRDMENVRRVISSRNDYLDFLHTINYVECHDGYTFFDRLGVDNVHDDEKTIINKCKLALALVVLSRGKPFIHAGQEFLRTKKGVHNSYNRDDDINQIDWNLRVRNNQICDYLKQLIAFRKMHNEFLTNGIEVYFEEYESCLFYHLGELIIMINPNDKEVIYKNSNYRVVFDLNGICDNMPLEIKIEGHSVIICKK